MTSETDSWSRMRESRRASALAPYTSSSDKPDRSCRDTARSAAVVGAVPEVKGLNLEVSNSGSSSNTRSKLREGGRREASGEKAPSYHHEPVVTSRAVATESHIQHPQDVHVHIFGRGLAKTTVQNKTKQRVNLTLSPINMFMRDKHTPAPDRLHGQSTNDLAACSTRRRCHSTQSFKL